MESRAALARMEAGTGRRRYCTHLFSAAPGGSVGESVCLALSASNEWAMEGRVSDSMPCWVAGHGDGSDGSGVLQTVGCCNRVRRVVEVQQTGDVMVMAVSQRNLRRW